MTGWRQQAPANRLTHPGGGSLDAPVGVVLGRGVSAGVVVSPPSRSLSR
jgi:hypothetical protein